MQSALPFIAAVTALLAVIVGPLITIRIARKRAQLEAIVLVRVETIKQLRALFSEFVAQLMIANSERGMGFLSRGESTAKLERAFRLETEISLMLNAEEEDCRTVMENMTAARCRVFKDSDAEFNPWHWQPHYESASIALIQVLNRYQRDVTKLR
jgi:hypothetical protein